MKEFLDKLPLMDIKEVNKISEEILCISGSLNRLERKYNLRPFDILNTNKHNMDERDLKLLYKYRSRIKELSEELDYVFLED